MEPSDSAPLEGVGVLVTRPAHQAGHLCRLIEQQGGTAIRFPVLEIAEPTDPEALRAAARRLEHFDYAVFVSANAVSRALEHVLAVREWPASVPIAVVGRRSAEELQRFGLRAAVFPPQGFSSEALLALPEMQRVEGRHIVVFRGDAGRELLAQTLRERGAEVEYVQAYRRLRPRVSAESLLQRWRSGDIDIALANSAESLENLSAMVGEEGRGLLRQTRLLVVSERMLPVVSRLGFAREPLVAENATDEAVLGALVAWKRSTAC
jgi:uroporphyrinogen-III synthase